MHKYIYVCIHTCTLIYVHIWVYINNVTAAVSASINGCGASLQNVAAADDECMMSRLSFVSRARFLYFIH